MPGSNAAADFRQQSSVAYTLFLVVLFAIAVALAFGGWHLFRWWGLAIGCAIGVVLFVAGAIVGGVLWVMTQDST